MRRHTLYIFLLLIVAVNNILPVQAQLSKQYALYNYRNDGDFNAWLNIDVDSITYSCFDLDSIEHDDVVVQEVWTPDSVYRIPLEVIDSIGFHAPAIEYQDNVFHITVQHLPYILKVDDFSILFSSTLPNNLRPKEGQVITSDTFDAPLSKGFAGKVKEINENENSFIVICEAANVTDVFKKLIIVGKAYAIDENEAKFRPHHAPKKLSEYLDSDHAEFEFPGTVSVKINDFISISDEVSMSADYYVYVDFPRFKLRATVTGTHDLKTDWTIDSDKILEWLGHNKDKNEPEWATPVWPIVNIPGVFNFGVRAGAFLAPSVKLSLTGSTPLTFTHTFGIEFCNTDRKSWIPTITPIMNAHSELGTPNIMLSLEGKLFAGIALGLKTTLISDNVLSGDITGRFGPEFDAKIQMKQEFGDDDFFNLYSLMKDSKVGVQLKADAKVNAIVFTDNLTDKLSWDWKWPIPKWEDVRYLFPDFTQPQLPLWQMPNPLSMFTTPSRDIIMPVKIGIGLFDVSGVKQFDYYNDELYLLDVDWHKNTLIDIGNLPPGSTYTCRPLINFLGLGEIYAEPRTTFTIPQPVSLSVSSLVMNVENTRDVRIKDGWGDFKVINMNPNIVSAEVIKHQLDDGTKISDVHVVCKAVGTAFIKVVDLRSKAETTLKVTVTNEVIPDDGIDLGLPSGTKWASYNIGATKPEEYGGYYAWGETEVRDQYYFTTYSLCDGTVSSCHDIGENISGTEYDVAHVKWGGEWCMPTKDDFQELVYTCEYKETTRNGVKGYQFTGPNGKYIFLPYTGYYWNTENSNVGSEGSYWSATQTTSVNRAHEMSFKKDEVLWDCYINRFAGLSVRPVIHSTPALVDLTLSSTEPITVKVDDKATIEITSGNGSYMAESDNEDVAIARVYDNATVMIKGISVGTATITVTDTKSGQTATVAVTVTGTINPDVSPGEAIDLGLPSGTKWASCNVGATKPEEYGGYYAWGETEEKEVYNWSTYIYCDGTRETCHDLGSDISGTDYDVAHVKWGGKWCMPTTAEQRELLDNCTTELTSLNGVNGRKFTSKINGNSIFLPAAGSRGGGDLYSAGEYGYYWSSTQYPDRSYLAYYLYFSSGSGYWSDYYYRYLGRSVRPVVRN